MAGDDDCLAGWWWFQLHPSGFRLVATGVQMATLYASIVSHVYIDCSHRNTLPVSSVHHDKTRRLKSHIKMMSGVEVRLIALVPYEQLHIGCLTVIVICFSRLRNAKTGSELLGEYSNLATTPLLQAYAES